MTIPEVAAVGPALVGVWHSGCDSSNITISNPSCPTLTPGSIVTVDINVTNVREFNAYELVLYFDPRVLTPVSIDETGTVLCTPTTPDCTFHNKEDLGTGQPGAVRLSVIKLGGFFLGGSGVLVRVNFRIERDGVSPLSLAEGMENYSTFAQGPGALTPNWTILTLGSDPVDSATSDGYFKNDPVKLGPVASFTFSPSDIQARQDVTFNATSSFDPDNLSAPNKGIRDYRWDFGDGGSVNVTVPTVIHRFAPNTGPAFTGNFSVRLTVVEDGTDGFLGMMTQRLNIRRADLHDVLIEGFSVQPEEVRPGEPVNVVVVLSNEGTFDENYTLTVKFGTPGAFNLTTLGERTGLILESERLPPFEFTANTTGLEPSFYEVSATIAVATETGSALNNNVAKRFVRVVEESNSPFLLIAGGTVVVAASIGTTGLLMRKRRRRDEDR